MTLYLIRHAQCLPKKAQRFSDWSLSRVGAQQAEELAGLLEPLEITNVFSSPFIRTIETAKPFAQKHGLLIRVVDDLRERLLTNEAVLPSDEVWRRSWEDFSFCLESIGYRNHVVPARRKQVAHEHHGIGIVVDNQNAGKPAPQGEVAGGPALVPAGVNRRKLPHRIHNPRYRTSLLYARCLFRAFGAGGWTYFNPTPRKEARDSHFRN